MDGLPTGSFVSRSSLRLSDDGTPVVGRERGIEPPKYTSTPMDGQVERSGPSMGVVGEYQCLRMTRV